MAFGHWLRKNAEKHLQEAAADELMSRYPESCEQPYREKGHRSLLLAQYIRSYISYDSMEYS